VRWLGRPHAIDLLSPLTDADFAALAGPMT
jgi:hypothetical protein